MVAPHRLGRADPSRVSGLAVTFDTLHLWCSSTRAILARPIALCVERSIKLDDPDDVSDEAALLERSPVGRDELCAAWGRDRRAAAATRRAARGGGHLCPVRCGRGGARRRGHAASALQLDNTRRRNGANETKQARYDGTQGDLLDDLGVKRPSSAFRSRRFGREGTVPAFVSRQFVRHLTAHWVTSRQNRIDSDPTHRSFATKSFSIERWVPFDLA